MQAQRMLSFLSYPLECTRVQQLLGHAFEYIHNIQQHMVRCFSATSSPFHMLTQQGQLLQLPPLLTHSSPATTT